jgi:methionyl-tRNA formyltransferase
MRLIMMGNGPFAAPTLRALYETKHEVLALVIRPARPTRGKTAAEKNPSQQAAESHGTPVLAPESVNDEASRQQLAAYQPDLFVVCDYGQILSRETLAIARLGGVNLHASLLPAYRGAAPINWAIYHGETITGVTVIHMTPRLDAGPAILQSSTPIGPDETAADVEPRLARLGAPLVCQAIELLAAGKSRPIEQDPARATKAPRLTKADGAVDWSRSAEQIRNQVRALEPWPKTHSYWLRSHAEPMRIILDQVAVDLAPDEGALPGTTLHSSNGRILVATGHGALAIERLQPAGKRVLTASEFLNGHAITLGERFGPIDA